MSGAYAALLASTSGAAACRSVTDPPLPPGAVRFTPPPVYARWWAQTEACSGLQGDLGAVAWYVTPGAPSISDGTGADLAGYYLQGRNEIVLADTAVLPAPAIRHEMLHALVRQRGHPRAQFVEACGGTVACVAACVTDAGPAGAPDPSAAVVPRSALVVRGALDPAPPARHRNGGLFAYTLLVTNPRTTPVVADLPAAGDARPPVLYGWAYERLCAAPPRPGLVPCLSSEWAPRVTDLAAAARFRAGETKRFVVDFQFAAERGRYFPVDTGTYVFRGSYGGDPRARTDALRGELAPPDTVVLGP